MTVEATGGAHPFIDPVSGRECILIAQPGFGLVVDHPDCDNPAEVAVELDAFFCQRCKWNGRLSGAWAVDVLEAEQANR